MGLCVPAIQGQVLSAGCTIGKQGIVCNQAGFQKAFADARTVHIETDPNNRMAASEAASAVVKLGKTVQAPGSSADLTLVVSRINTEGVMIGPAGTELSTLRVYGLGAGGRRGDLIWSETYTGQPDMSWPAIVQGLLRQWQTSLTK